MGYFLLIIILAFIAVVLTRTIMFKPKPQESREIEDIEFDSDKAIKNLQKLVKCKTVSYFDHSLEDDKEFKKLVNMLPKLYPNVCEKLELTKFDGRALLFHWKGKKKGDPAVFMAHYDVVPVDEDGWSKPAFEALIEDGAIKGDVGDYPDTTPEFLKQINELNKVNNYEYIPVKAPFIEKEKYEVVLEALKLGVPLDKTWSCYVGGDEPCGECYSCQSRIKAIEKAEKILKEGN